MLGCWDDWGLFIWRIRQQLADRAPCRVSSRNRAQLSTCLFIICLSVCLSIYLSIYLSISLSLYPPIHLSICLSPSLSPSLSRSVCPYLSRCLPLCISLATYLPHLHIYVYPHLHHHVHLHLYLCVSNPIYMYVYIHIYVPIYIHVHVDIYLFIRPYVASPEIRSPEAVHPSSEDLVVASTSVQASFQQMLAQTWKASGASTAPRPSQCFSLNDELQRNLKPETPETKTTAVTARKGFVAKMACSFPTNQAIVVGGGLGGGVGLFVL